MTEAKPTSIKLTGWIIAISSALMLFSNMMEFNMAFYLSSESEGTANNLENSLQDPLHAYAQPLALAAVLLSLAFFIAGIFILRHKNWARILAMVVAVLFIVHIWLQAVFMAGNNPADEGAFTSMHFILAVAWSVPLVLLIWYLNQQKVKHYFTAS